MNNKRGFTLTEVLLAVLVVGLIGIALASLTTAASRESGVGRSRVMLRNSISRALRQLRQDVHDSSRVLYVRNRINSVSGTTLIPLLRLGQNIDLSGNAIAGLTPRYITYCFKPGTITTTASGVAVEPTAAHSGVSGQPAKDGGTIYRIVRTTPTSAELSSGVPTCSDTASDIFLENVKFIPPATNTSSEYYYPVPLFAAVGSEGSSSAYNAKAAGNFLFEGRLKVNFILELHSSPVVNDAADEEFVLPVGYSDSRTTD